MLTFICVSKTSSIFIKTIKISSAELRVSSICFNPAEGWSQITDHHRSFRSVLEVTRNVRVPGAHLKGRQRQSSCAAFSLCGLGQAPLTHAAFPTTVPAFTLAHVCTAGADFLGELSQPSPTWWSKNLTGNLLEKPHREWKQVLHREPSCAASEIGWFTI